MKKMSFVLSSFLTIALLSGCAADSAQVQTPPTADPVVKSDLNTFNGWNAGFQLDYPIDFEVNSIQDPQSKAVLTLVYPGYYKQGTNLNEAKIIVSESRDKDDVAKCTTGESTGKALTATKTVHSQAWYQETWSDGAAGHTGDNVQYSTDFYEAT